MRHRAAIAGAFAWALLSGGALAQTPATRSTSWLQRRLETGLAAALGGTVRIGRIDVDWTTLAATIGDVAISIPAEGAAPLTASIGEARVKLSWSGLGGIAGGDVHLTEVLARRATFSCSREWIDSYVPNRKKKDGEPVAIQIDRLVVDDAAAEYLDGRQRVRIQARAMSFHGDWSSSRRLLIGEVRADATVEAPLFDRPWSGSVRGGLRLGGGRLEIFGATGEGPGARGELAGNVTWGSGASFTAHGRLDADLSALSPFIVGDVILAGHAEGPVQIVYTGGVPIRVTMQAETSGLRIGPIATDTARADLTIRPGRLDVANVDARGYGGAFTGTVGLAFGPKLALETDLAGEGADLSRLIRLTGKDLPIASTADVTLKIAGEPGKIATWTGGGTFDAARAPAGSSGRIPADGKGRLTFESGRVRVTAEELSLAEATLGLSFEADVGPHAGGIRLELSGRTRSARATQLAAQKLMDAFGVERNKFAVLPVEGAGTLRADVRTGRDAHFDLTLDLTRGSYAGEPFDRAVLDLSAGGGAVELRRVDLSGGGQSVAGSARFNADSGGLEDVDISAKDVALSSVLTQFGVKVPVDGRADLTLRGWRDADGFAAQGEVKARNVIVGREIVDSIESPVRIEGDRIILDGLVARGHGHEAHARVSYDLATAHADVDLVSATVDIASNRTLAEAGLTAKGRVQAQGSIMIDREGASGLLSVVASEILVDAGQGGLREIRLGDFDGTATIAPHGLELTVNSLPAGAWTFDGFFGFTAELPVSAVLYFDDLVAGAGGVFGESVDLRLKGQVQAEGDLTEPRKFEINGALDEVAVRIGPSTLRAAEPFPLRLENGRFVLGPTRFEGESAGLEIAASGSIDGGDLAGSLRGTVDLAIISSLWSEVRGGGPVTIDATLGGTLEQPDLSGKVTVRGGRLRVIGYPQTLESIDSEAIFEKQTLTLSSFHALQGGGEVSATGKIEFKGILPVSFHAEFTGANVVAAFPEGFKGTYEGHLEIDGTPKRAMITGRIEVVRGLYTKNFDVGLFGGIHREFDAESESPFPRNLFLDVDVVAPGNVWLRNDVAKVEATGQIHIGGEMARPEVTGRFAMVPGGTVRYRDVDYLIDYGTVELTDPKRLNPYVDFRGHTRVAEYEIALHVEGTLDKFTYELTSTPPLASQDIISLLVTGRTLDTLTGSASAAALPGDMAAYYFAGLLSSTLGKQIQNSLGIDQLAITPLLLKGESDPTARVTVGKQVSDTVKILFSQDIGTAQKQTYQVSWDASRRVRLIAESDTEAGVGGELQYARQFGGTPIESRQDGAAATVASVTVEAEDGTPLPSLVKRAKIRVGDRFERGRMLQGGDRIRAACVKEGFLQTTVRADAVPDPGPPETYRIVYRVARGPHITVDLVVNGGRGKRALKKALKAFWSETPYTPEYWDEATHALIDELQESGYYAADATWHAQDGPAGRSIRIIVDRGKPVKLRDLRFTGVASLPLERVEKQMASLKRQSMRKRRLRPSVLAADLAAVRALYREEGFTRVRIEPPQIALTATGDSADVDVTIHEGPRFTVGDVTFNSDVDAMTEDEMRDDAPLAGGAIFSPRRLAETEQTLKDRFDARGYPDVRVESRVALQDDRANVAFDIAAGDRKSVGAITIAGNRVTKKKTIAQALTFGRGDFVSNQALLKSQQQLYRTALFSNVKLTFAPIPGGDGRAQTVTVRVDEAPPLSLGLGVGYDSEDGPRASFLLGYSNLGGRNVAILFQARVSGKENQEVLTVRRRHVFGNTIDTLGSLLYETTAEDSFSSNRRALSIRLEQRPKPRWISFLRYTIQDVRIFDITDFPAALDQIFEDKLSNIRLGDVGLGVVRDTRDDAFAPTRGGYGSIEGSVFARPLGSEASFAKLFLRGSLTLPLPRGNRLALFLRVGGEFPFADTEAVPLSERFFAGGSTTMRGFATDTVGGVQVSGFYAGGEALLLLNNEWTFPIWRALRGEIFLDVGNVYPTVNDFDATDIRSAAGLGLRLDTPIGPIRVEYGWKLDRRPEESPGELVFGIGVLF
jgi:outer membrane protein assembly complex protein YaeT